MNVYKDMYFSLFNAVTNAIEYGYTAEQIKNMLRLAQIKTEEMFINCNTDGEM